MQTPGDDPVHAFVTEAIPGTQDIGNGVSSILRISVTKKMA